jgi:hypothetical protein
MRLRELIVLGAVVASGARVASAQVGTPPSRSPYRDLEYRQEFTLFGGWFNARHDPASVGPQSGPLTGFRYAIRMGGPAYATARVAGASLERNVLNPQVSGAARHVGTESVSMLLADVALELQLTGFKSWHGLAPVVNGGLGLTADLSGKTDVGGYRFGQPFSIVFGTGLKYARGGRWSGRLDWSNQLYRIHYPDSYYVKSGDDDPILPTTVKRDIWRRNNVFMLGLTYANFR